MELNFKKVRRKPVVMEALELSAEFHKQILNKEYKIGKYSVKAVQDIWNDEIDNYFLINTLEDIDWKTLHRGELGDFLIKGVTGEIWAIKPDIFKETYEEI